MGLGAGSCGRGSVRCPSPRGCRGAGGQSEQEPRGHGCFWSKHGGFVRVIESSTVVLAPGSPGTSRLQWPLLFRGPKPPKLGSSSGLGVQDRAPGLRELLELPGVAHSLPSSEASRQDWHGNDGQGRCQSLLPWLWHGQSALVGAAIPGTAGFGVKGSKSAGGKQILVFSREQMGLCISMRPSGTRRSWGEPPALLLGLYCPQTVWFPDRSRSHSAGEGN